MAEDNTVTEAKTLIRNLISQIHNQDFTNAATNYHDSLIIIKPDGTLTNKNGWINTVTNSDIRVVSNELLLWNFFELSENKDMIFCGYTTKFKFSVPNENETFIENAIFTALLKKYEGAWKIYYLQRTDAIINEQNP